VESVLIAVMCVINYSVSRVVSRNMNAYTVENVIIIAVLYVISYFVTRVV